MIQTQLFINNQWIEAKESEKIIAINPSDESVIAEVSCADHEAVNYAVKSARTALNSEWRKTDPWDRGRVLMKISELVEQRLDQMVAMEMQETGKPFDAATVAIKQVARYFEFYAGVADKIQGASIPLGEQYIDFTLREPIGVTAHIVPWNVPLNMLARGVAPALAAGCTAVIKPAEQTPLGALQFAQICLDAGLPAGVVNVINGFGYSTGAALASHADIDLLVFTGSVQTGKTVMKLCAEHVKPVVLELGGKSPILAFDDADPKRVANEAIKGIFSNTGQYCDAGSRLLLSQKIENQVLDCLLEKTHQLSTGMPQENPDMGPLISAEQQQQVLTYIQQGTESSAQLLCGGKKPQSLDKGYFIEPTIFSQVSEQHSIAQEEIFGPVLSVLQFTDEEQALAIANNSKYGLAAGIFTQNIDRALRLTKQLDVGTVYVNEYFSGEMASPFGGVKQSGIGRERGLETLVNYTRIKNVIIHIHQQ